MGEESKESSRRSSAPLEDLAPPAEGASPEQARREKDAGPEEAADLAEEHDTSQEKADDTESTEEPLKDTMKESGSEADGDSSEARESSKRSSGGSKRESGPEGAEEEQDVHEVGDLSPRSPEAVSENEDNEAETEMDTDVGEGESDTEYATEGVARVCSFAKALDLSEARLIRVPVDILEYSALVQLQLEKNLLSSVQPELMALHGLKVLSLASNRISSLPEGLDKAWPQLMQLDLSKNSFEEFPDILTRITSLVSLKLTHNSLKRIPEGIVALEQLSSLDLRNNKVEALPASLVDLKSLRRLAVQSNQLQELPPKIEGMGLDAIGIQGNPGEAAMLERMSGCKGLVVDAKVAGDAEGHNKLPKSWSSKISLKSRDFAPSRKASKQKKPVKRKSQTHDDSMTGLGLYAQQAKKAHKDKSADKRDKHAEKKPAEEKKKKAKKDKQVVPKQEVDLLPGKFQNGINFALTGSELRVRGASIDRLIALLTYDCGIDLAEYQRSFVTMYPEFVEDLDLMAALVSRHQNGGAVAQDRVMKLFNLWISTHKTKFFGEDGAELKEKLSEFCTTVSPKGDSLMALLGRLEYSSVVHSTDTDQEKRMKKLPKDGGWHELETKQSTFQRTMSMQFAPGDAQKGGHIETSWKSLKPRKLAEQLCLISHAQFKHIEVHEWLNKAWSKENGQELAPNLVAFIDWTNRESAVFTAHVLNQKSATARGHAIAQLLNTAEKCVELNNFSSAWSIFSALNGAAINQQRLKLSWEGVPMKSIRILHDMEVLFDMSGNFLNFRTQLKKVKPPCIPSVMLVTKDLIFMDEGNPKALEDGSINFELYNMKAQTILHVRDLQRLGYDDFTPIETVQFEFFQAEVMTQQEAYELSLFAEPKHVAVAPEIKGKAEAKGKADKAETKGKGGTLKGAKKRQTFRALAKQLFSDQDLTKTLEDGSASSSARDKSPRTRARSVATPKDQLAALEKEGIVIPACGDKSTERVPSIDRFPPSPTTIRSSRDDSSLPSSRISTTRKKSMEAGSGAVVIKDDSSLDEKSEADRKFAALLSPRALTSTSPKLDAAKRITVRTNAQSVDMFKKEAATPLPQRSHKTMIQRQAGSGAPGTGLARRPLNFLAPPLPVGETSVETISPPAAPTAPAAAATAAYALGSDAPTPRAAQIAPAGDVSVADADSGTRLQISALKDLPDPVASPKACDASEEADSSDDDSDDDSDLPSLEHPTPVASPAPAKARPPSKTANGEEEPQEELPVDGEAILEELSGLLSPSRTPEEEASSEEVGEGEEKGEGNERQENQEKDQDNEREEKQEKEEKPSSSCDGDDD